MRGRRPEAPPPEKTGFLAWLKKLFGGTPKGTGTRAQQEQRALEEFQQHFRVPFGDTDLLKLALTHRSYLSVTGQGPRESNERLEFLGDSVLGLVTSEYLYRENPEEHEGDLTKSKSLLVSKAILSRRALAMGLGRFVLMSHSEVESGGRQRLSILADAFEAVIGAIYLDQGFEPAREFIHKWLLRESGAIVADKRHTNYKSHLQEYVQSTWRTHPVYRIRSEMGPDHSKHFLVEVLVGKRSLGEGRGRNKKEAEQAAARTALERAGVMPGEEEIPVEVSHEPEREVDSRRPERGDRGERIDRGDRGDRGERGELRDRGERRDRSEGGGLAVAPDEDDEDDDRRSRRRDRRPRRGGRIREEAATPATPVASAGETGRLAMPTRRLEPLPESPELGPPPPEVEPPPAHDEDEEFEIGRPEGPFEELRVDPFAWANEPQEAFEPAVGPEDVETAGRGEARTPVVEPDEEAVDERRRAGERGRTEDGERTGPRERSGHRPDRRERTEARDRGESRSGPPRTFEPRRPRVETRTTSPPPAVTPVEPVAPAPAVAPAAFEPPPPPPPAAEPSPPGAVPPPAQFGRRRSRR